MPQPHGGALVPGAGGGPQPGSGRPPGPFKALLRRIRESPELAASIEAAVADHESRAFPAALKLLSDYDDEKPAEKRQIVGPIEVRVRVTREGRRVTAS